MSFDIFVGAYKRGESVTFPRRIAEEIFADLINMRGASGWSLKLPRWGAVSGFVYISDDPDCDGFMVSRPPFSRVFYDAVLTLMRRTSSVVYWPGKGVCICAPDPETVAELPPDMIEVLGQPKIVTSAADIPAAIGLDPETLED